MSYLRPQSPLKNENEDYFYPLTTVDQIIVNDSRLSDYSIISDKDINITLLASKWIKVNEYYTQTVTINNLNEDYNVDVKLAYIGIYETDLAINENSAHITYAIQNNNIITFYCLKDKPKINIPIELEVYI